MALIRLKSDDSSQLDKLIEQFDLILEYYNINPLDDTNYLKLAGLSNRLNDFLKNSKKNLKYNNQIEPMTSHETKLRFDNYRNTPSDFILVLTEIFGYSRESFLLLSVNNIVWDSKFFCIVCKETFNEPKEIARHVLKPNHRFEVTKEINNLVCNMNKFPILIEDEFNLTNKFCELCNIHFNNIDDLKIHFHSALHFTFSKNSRPIIDMLCKFASQLIGDFNCYIPITPKEYMCIFCIENIPLNEIISHLDVHKNEVQLSIEPNGYICMTCNYQGDAFSEVFHECKTNARIICYICKNIITSNIWYNIRKHLLKHKNEITKKLVLNKESKFNLECSIFIHFQSPYTLQAYLEEIVFKAERENNDIYQRHKRIILFIKNQLSQFLGESPKEIFLFGSRISGLYLQESDLDVCFDIDPFIKKLKLPRQFFEIGQMLINSFESAGPEEVLNCHIPVPSFPRIRFRHNSTKTDVDLTYKTGIGIFNTELTILFTKIQPKLISLIRIVKLLARNQSLVDYPKFTSHSLMVLVIFFMQTRKELPLLPSVKTIKDFCKNKKKCVTSVDVTLPEESDIQILVNQYINRDHLSLYELTREFFIFLNKTDWNSMVLSPYYGKLFPRLYFKTTEIKSEIKEYYIQKSLNNKDLIYDINKTIILQDPLDLTKNITDKISTETLNHLQSLAYYMTDIMK